MNNQPVECRAGGVIYRKTGDNLEYLLVTSNSNKNRWIFPAGHIEEGEEPAVAALREVVEEAGIEACIIIDLGSFQYSWSREGKKILIDTNLFLMEYQQTIQTNPEGRQVRFFSYEEILGLNIWEESKAFLGKARLLINTTLAH